MKRILSFVLLAAALPAGAWDIAVNVTIDTASKCPVFLDNVSGVYSTGSPFAYQGSPVVVPDFSHNPNGTVTWTDSTGWLVNTVPQGQLTLHYHYQDGTAGTLTGGNFSWSGAGQTADASGSFVIPAENPQDYTIHLHNPSQTEQAQAFVIGADGFNPSLGSEGYYLLDPGYDGTETVTVEPCDLPFTITYNVLTNGMVINNTNPPSLPDLSTNEQSLANTPPDTNSIVPTAPANNSSNILWQASGTTPATDQNIKDLGNGLNNTLWTANQQNQLDSSAIVQAINTAKTQAHSDAGTLKSAIDTGRQQSHSDLTAIAGLLQNITNGSSKGVNMTNYALDSTLQASAAQQNTNFQLLISAVNSNGTAGLGGALTNATDAVNGLASSISNIANITNLDIASEGTLQGGTNMLGIINSNIVAMGTNRVSFTNYNLESTQMGISNLLAGMATNGFGDGWSNGLTLDQLTNQASAYQQQLSNSQDNAMAQMAELTNQASQMGMGSVVAGVQGGLPGSVEVDSGSGVSPQVITLASGIQFSLGSNMPSYGPMRQILAWATIVGLFLYNWRTTYSKIRDVFTANQATTAGTEILGSNVNLSSAMLMAVAIFAAATAIPTFAIAIMNNEVSLYISIGNPLGLIHGLGWGYEFLDQYIPLATVVTAVTSRVVFNVVIDSIATVVMGIKLFLVGL